jgi:hypothetical protein
MAREGFVRLKWEAFQNIESWGLEFSGNPDKKYATKIISPKGKNLGVNVAEALIAEKDDLVRQLEVRKKETKDNYYADLLRSALISSVYALPAQDLLKTEETAKCDKLLGEGDIVSPSHPFLALLVGYVNTFVSRVLAEKVAERKEQTLNQVLLGGNLLDSKVSRYFQDRQLNLLLQEKADALEFIDSRTAYYQKALLSPNEPVRQQFEGAVASELVGLGRERFYTLYIAATLAQGRAAGRTAQEQHQDFVRLTFRKNQQPG